MFIKKLHHNFKKRLKIYSISVGIIISVLILIAYGIIQKNNDTMALNDFGHYEKDAYQKPADITPEAVKEARPIKLPILMYHYVEYVQDSGDTIRKSLNVTPDVFKKQLQTLKDAGYTTYFARDVPKILDGSMKVGDKSIILTFDDGYEDFHRVVFPILKSYNVKATVFMIYDFIGRKQFLKDKDIRELLDSGLVEIGSHTLHHMYLKKVSSEVARKQIFESKQKLEEQFGIHVDTFAYPYGAFKQETIDLVKEASYSAAFSVIKGQIQSQGNIFYLSRIRMGSAYGKGMLKVLEKLNK